MNIFLSHSSKDKPCVIKFKEKLPSFLSACIDYESLSWGDTFKIELKSTIESSIDFLVIFLSDDSLSSPWVREELDWAIQRERKLNRTFILPILLPNTEPKKLPAELRKRHCLRLSDYDPPALIDVLAKQATEKLCQSIVENYSSSIVQRRTNDVVLYFPILHLNQFFSTFLEVICDRAQLAGFNVIVKKAHNLYSAEPALSVDDFLDEINKSPLKQSTIVVFPPNPESYRELLNSKRIEEFRDLNVILMDIDPFEGEENSDARKKQLSDAQYIKAVIVLDNQKACEMAAKKVIECVEGHFDYVNVILCDGDYHGRAEKFCDAMSVLSKKAKKVDGSKGGIFVEYIPPRLHGAQVRIKFSSAFKGAYKYVRDVLNDYIDNISKCPTFIFCANDVIALGARAALGAYPKEKLKHVFIIAYDGSTLLTEFLESNDSYIKILLSQNYDGYTDCLLKQLRKIAIGDERTANKLKRIDPKIDDSPIRFSRGCNPPPSYGLKSNARPMLRQNNGQWSAKNKPMKNIFDVFLCHNSEDKSEVKKIGLKLKEEGLRPWLDEWELPPGIPWQSLLETHIDKIDAAAVFIGPSGIGPWQDMELKAYLREFVNRGSPVIPVILPSLSKLPELPVFLRGMTCVDFRQNEQDPLVRLIWGITGEKSVSRVTPFSRQ